MKRVHQEQGERDWAFEDLRELQSEPLRAVDGVFGSFGDCVISGCNVVGNTISSGMVSIGGKVMPFEGATDVTFPCKLVASVEEITGKYVDNGDKPIAHNYKAVVAAEGEGIEITASGAASILRPGSDAVDSDSSTTFATSKAVAAVNTKLGELAGKELLKSDAIDLEDSDTLATSMAVATAVKHLDSKIIDTSLPVNTILATTAEAGNIFGDKWLKCDGSQVEGDDYPDLAIMGRDNDIYTLPRIIKSTKYFASNYKGFEAVKVLINNNIAVVAFEYDNWPSGSPGSPATLIAYTTNLNSWIISFDEDLNRNPSDLLYVNGIYYFTAGAAIYKSLNLGTWDIIIGFKPFEYIRQLNYINGLYIRLHKNNSLIRLHYTNDLLGTWNECNIPIDVELDINFDYGKIKNINNRLFLINPRYSKLLLFTSDGINWTKTNIDVSYNNRKVFDVGYFNNKYWVIVVNNISSKLSSDIYTSSNGTDWTFKFTIPKSMKSFILPNENILIISGDGGYAIDKAEKLSEIINSSGVYDALGFINGFLFNISGGDNKFNAFGIESLFTTVSNKKTLPTIANSYIKSLK